VISFVTVQYFCWTKRWFEVHSIRCDSSWWWIDQFGSLILLCSHFKWMVLS